MRSLCNPLNFMFYLIVLFALTFFIKLYDLDDNADNKGIHMY
jgi:hypothetical protein